MAVGAPDYRAATSWMDSAAEADVLQIIEKYRKRYVPERVILVRGSAGASPSLGGFKVVSV